MSRRDYYYHPSAPKANSLVVASSAVILNSENKILLQKRRDNNKWSLPGGAMELGETISDSIIREVFEETGFIVQIEGVIGIYSDPKHVIEYSNGEIRQQFSICFRCIIIDGQLKVSDESFEVKFFDLSEISEIEMHEAQRIRINDSLHMQSQPYLR